MICATCRAEVRFGWRDGSPGWFHRESVDHPARPVAAPVVEESDPVPEPEIRSTPLEKGDPRIPGGCKQIVNLVAKQEGWEAARLTYARGPYVGGKGEVLSISDSVVLGVRGPQVDGVRRVAVASWRDGKFDFGYICTTESLAQKASSTDMKKWIKGEPCLTASA